MLLVIKRQVACPFPEFDTPVNRKSKAIIFLPKHSFQPISLPKNLLNYYVDLNKYAYNSKINSKILNQIKTKKLSLPRSNISGNKRAKNLLNETFFIKWNLLTVKSIFFMAEISVNWYFIFLPQESSHFLFYFSNYKLKIYKK